MCLVKTLPWINDLGLTSKEFALQQPSSNLIPLKCFLNFSGIQSVVVTSVGITSLGLRSLKEISDGDVTISKNPNLCYTNKSHWERFFKSSGQSASLNNNANSASCGPSHFPFPVCALCTQPETFTLLIEQHFHRYMLKMTC